MKVHIGADAETGVVHSVRTTPANVHDVTEAHRLLHGGENRVWGESVRQPAQTVSTDHVLADGDLVELLTR